MTSRALRRAASMGNRNVSRSCASETRTAKSLGRTISDLQGEADNRERPNVDFFFNCSLISVTAIHRLHRVPGKRDGCSSVAYSHRIECGWMQLGSWGWRERLRPPLDPLSLGNERHPARLNALDRPA